MFVLLLDPPPPDIERAAVVLARHLGGTPYDHRAPLLRGIPYLAGWNADAQIVQQRAVELRDAGLTAFAMAQAALERTPALRRARAVAWTLDGMRLGFREGPGELTWQDVAWSEIALALPCRADSAQEILTATTKKTTNMAAMAMGLPISSKKTTTERNLETDSRFFCVLWLPTRDALVRIDAESTDWRGLGAAMRPGSLANFQWLLEALRTRVPNAWDARLERAGGKIAAAPAPPQSSLERVGKTTIATTTRSWDSESGVMQALRLLVLARMLRASQQIA